MQISPRSSGRAYDAACPTKKGGSYGLMLRKRPSKAALDPRWGYLLEGTLLSWKHKFLLCLLFLKF